MSKKINVRIIKTSKSNTNNKESKLIQFINSYPTIIIEEPISSISQQLSISTSTLTRTIRKLGFKNYTSFRTFVVKKITENKKHLLMCKEINKYSNTLKIFSMLSNILIEQTFNNIEVKKFDLMINEIICAKKVFLFGVEFSHLICQQLCKYFKVLNINSYNISDFYHAICLINNSAKNSVWIIVSTSITTRELIFLIKKLTLNNDTKIVVVTGNDKHIILKNVFYILKIESLTKVKNEIFHFSYDVVLTAVANLLINSVINKINYNKVKKILEYKEKTSKWKR